MPNFIEVMVCEACSQYVESSVHSDVGIENVVAFENFEARHDVWRRGCLYLLPLLNFVMISWPFGHFRHNCRLPAAKDPDFRHNLPLCIIRLMTDIRVVEA